MTQTRRTFSLVALVVLAVLVGRPAAAQEADSENREAPDITISVKGMVCENCAYAVERRVGKLGGVEAVEVHLDEQQVHVTLVPGKKANEDDLREAILDAGFEPIEIHYPLPNDSMGVHTDRDGGTDSGDNRDY